MRKSYTRAVSTGRVMMVFGGMTPRLQLSHSDSGARRPSPHRSSKSADPKPFDQPVEFKPGRIQNKHTVHVCISVCVFMSKLCLESLTEDVGLQAVLLKEGHITIAFPTGISNQTPVSNDFKIKKSVPRSHCKHLATDTGENKAHDYTKWI